MNRTKKYVILILSIAMLTVVLIGGSWAYFTDSDESKNIVTMGHVQISLDEPEFEKITKNTYHQDDVMPTQIIVKDPTVTIKEDSEDCYIRVKILVNGFDQLPQDSKKTKQEYCEELETTFKVKQNEDYVSMKDYGWIKSGDYYYYVGGNEDGICHPRDVIPVFSQFTIPRDWDEEIAEQEFKITISAEAIQAANFKPTRTDDIIEWLITQSDGKSIEVTPESYIP